MAMRYNRFFVFLGSIGALVVMTVLSVCIGVAVPSLLPRSYTHYAAAALFAYFGAKLLHEAWHMTPGQPSEELQEAEEHLNEKGLGGADAGKEDEEAEAGAASAAAAPDAAAASVALSIDGDSGPAQRGGNGGKLGGGGGGGMGGGGGASASSGGGGGALAAPGGSSWSRDWPILAQAFTITFVAEWGDRSQIATIAMAAAQEPFGVTLGACIGHALCTGLAVIGGRLLSTRISERAVACSGGVLFLIFALHSLIVGPE